MSRNKGKRGELEVAHYLTNHGLPAHRGRQFSGSPDSPDVVCDALGMHIEVKRTERFSPYAAMQQAVEDAGDKVPCVWHRRGGKDWLVVLRAEDFVELVK